MGYMSKFDMGAFDAKTGFPIDDALEAEIAEKLGDIIYGGSSYWTYDSFDRLLGDEMKWYDHEDDVIAISKEYPNIVFVLEGIGEEFPDAWRMWAHNGEWEKVSAEVTYPMPSKSKFMPFRIV